MEYKTGKIFETYPPIEVINWCNATQHTVEKCDKGYKIVVPSGFVEVDGQCRAMTQKEQFEAKEITEDEYTEIIRHERDSLIAQIESSKEYKKALRLYRNGDTKAMNEFDEKIQKLLDIPQREGFPKTFTGFEEFLL